MTADVLVLAQALASGAQVVSVVFLVVQLVLMRGQINVAQQTIISQQDQLVRQTTASIRVAQGANVLEVIKYLEDPLHLTARQVANSLIGKPLEEWSQEERKAADLVSRIWTQAPILQKLELLPPLYLQYYYGNTIMRHWNAVRPIVEERRRQTESAICFEFEEMANEVESLGWFKDGKDNRPRDRYLHFS